MTEDPRWVKQPPLKFKIGFRKGLPAFITTETTRIEDSLQIFTYLNKIGGLYGIGRIDITENRYIGLKVRTKELILPQEAHHHSFSV